MIEIFFCLAFCNNFSLFEVGIALNIILKNMFHSKVTFRNNFYSKVAVNLQWFLFHGNSNSDFHEVEKFRDQFQNVIAGLNQRWPIIVIKITKQNTFNSLQDFLSIFPHLWSKLESKSITKYRKVTFFV